MRNAETPSGDESAAGPGGGSTAGFPDDENSLAAVGEPSISVSVFQVLASDGGIAGVGFLSGEDTGFTCAHVVRAAGQSPGDRVEVLFPHLPDAPRVMAHVVAEEWRAPEAEDVAVLRLDSVPAGARGMAVGTSTGCRGHRVFSFGFPTQAPQGGHFGYGEVGGLLPGNNGVGRLLQLAKANDLTTGFSGGPVVDEMTGLVIGMVTSIVSPDAHLKGLGIAYATPAEVLREIRPQLAEHEVCPYLGLKSFTAQHADWFHGREAAVERVLAALGGDRRVLMLLGPSGAGKSSLINAGVLPALAEGAIPGSDRWLPLCARPGQDLLTELEGAGLPGAATDGLLAAAKARLAAEPDHDRLLLVIDQFEELLTQPVPDSHQRADDGRLRAADQLVELAGSHAAVTMLLVMRNDFYAPLDALAPDLMNSALPGLCNVPATLSRSDLQAIITRPAVAVGLPLETGLANRIINDVLDTDPAARQAPVTLLPPLELALRQLWIRRRREDGQLTHAAYEKIGKVTGSLTAWCNHALSQLPAAQHPTAQRVLTALVRPADDANGIPATRQPVPLTRLRALATDQRLTGPAADAAFDAVLEALTRYRIITTDTTTPPGAPPGEAAAELIHDALIRGWTELGDWVAQDHQFQVWLLRAAEQQGRHADSRLPGDLLDGSLLAEGEEWAGQRPLPGEIISLLEASRQHQQSAIRRTRRINAALAGILALALIATAIAFYQQRAARSEQQEAERQRDLVLYNQVLATADRLRSTDVSMAAQLTLVAHRMHPTGDTYSRLVTAGNTPLSTPLTAHRAAVCALAISPDGRTLATGSKDFTMRLWDISAPTRPRPLGEPLAGFGDVVCALAFSPNGRMLVTGSNDRTVRLWNVSDPDHPKPVGSPLPGYNKTSRSVRAVAFSPDGRTLATGSYPGSNVAPITDPGLRLWDVSDPARPRLLSQTVDGAEFVDHLAFTPDGRTLVATPSGKSLLLWNISDPKHPKALAPVPTGHSENVSALALSPDGRTVVTGSRDQTLRVWDVSDPSRVKALGRPVTGLTRGVESLAFSRDGHTVAAGAGDSTIRLWNMSDRTAPASLGPPLAGHADSVDALAFTPDGRTLVSGDQGSTMRLWNVPARLLTGRTLGYSVPDYIAALAFSPDGRTLVSGHFDKSVRWWNVSDPAQPTSLRPPVTMHTYTVCALAFSPDGRTLATGSMDQTALLWDVSDPKRPKALSKLTGHAGSACSLEFSPDGRTLATASKAVTSGTGEGSVFLWDVSDPAQPKVLGQPLRDVTGGVNALAFSPDGRILAAADGDSRVRLWDVSERSQAAPLGEPLSEHTASIGGLAFSPDGRTLASGGSDAVRLRDVSDPKRPRALKTLTGYTGTVGTMVFSPDGRTLATGGTETVRLWDVSDPKRAVPRGEPLEGHTSGIRTLAFSPDGRTLASAGSDQVIRLWDMDLGQDIKRICAVTRNTPTADEWSRHISSGIPFPAPC